MKISSELTDNERLQLIGLEAASLRDFIAEMKVGRLEVAAIERILFLACMSSNFLEDNRDHFDALIERAKKLPEVKE